MDTNFPKLFLKFTIVFSLIFILGIWFAKPYIYLQEIGYIDETSIINDNPNDISNSLFIIIYIIVLTALILLLAKRFSISWLIIALDSLLVFFAFTLLLSFFFDYLSIPLALLFVFLRRLKPNNTLIKNIAAIGAISVVGVLIGTSLGIYPMLFLLVALSIYDLIAVFKTKHMITLAKTFQKEKTSFTLTLLTQVSKAKQKTKKIISKTKVFVSKTNQKTKKLFSGIKSTSQKNTFSKTNPYTKQTATKNNLSEPKNTDTSNKKEKKSFELGTGDLVIPLAFCTSLLKYTTPTKALLCILASYIGLSITIWYAYYKRKPLPALPFQSLLMIIAFFLPF